MTNFGFESLTQTEALTTTCGTFSEDTKGPPFGSSQKSDTMAHFKLSNASITSHTHKVHAKQNFHEENNSGMSLKGDLRPPKGTFKAGKPGDIQPCKHQEKGQIRDQMLSYCFNLLTPRSQESGRYKETSQQSLEQLESRLQTKADRRDPEEGEFFAQAKARLVFDN